MNRLDFLCDSWYPHEDVPLKSTSKLMLPDFRGEEKACWHLRGRAWRWVIVKCCYPKLTLGEEYELYFWARFDYFSNQGARCFIEICDSDHWEDHITYNIAPNSPNAIARSGDWVLYRFPIKSIHGKELWAQIIAFEANIAIMQADPGDEKDERVIATKPEDKEPFIINNELPFKEYTYLEQRMVKYYAELLAPYHPCHEISETAQREYYSFVNGIYDKLFSSPQGFFPKLCEDDAFPNRFNNASYGKPELKNQMKKDQAKIEELFTLLLEIGRTGQISEGKLFFAADISRKQRALLTYMGFDIADGALVHEQYNSIGEAIAYLSGKEKALWSLMFCWFDDTYPYLEKTFAKHYDREQYERLLHWLYTNGYRMSIGSSSGITLDYYKSISKDEKPLGYAIHGDKLHYGYSFEFRREPRVMQHGEPRIIQYGEMLKRYDEMSEDTRKLMSQRTKHCDGCRYCVQTDKTGKRPFAAIKLSDGTARCPYYPGFNFTFERLSKQNTDSIIAFLTDLENVVIK